MRLAALLLTVAWPGAALAERIAGTATVLDGNTLEIDGRPVRLRKIDAPDLDQVCQDRSGADYACGRHARDALAAHLRDETISCEANDQDEARRPLAVCRSGRGDVNAWMVGEGHAVAVRGTDAPYANEDRTAWARRAGLWSGVFEEPAEWRRRDVRAVGRLRESRNRQVARAQ